MRRMIVVDRLPSWSTGPSSAGLAAPSGLALWSAKLVRKLTA